MAGCAKLVFRHTCIVMVVHFGNTGNYNDSDIYDHTERGVMSLHMFFCCFRSLAGDLLIMVWLLLLLLKSVLLLMVISVSSVAVAVVEVSVVAHGNQC